MPTPTKLRLDEPTRQRIARIARRKQVSASEIMRDAIEALVQREESATAPYERMADLVDSVRGGDPKLSSRTGERFKRLFDSGRSSGS